MDPIAGSTPDGAGTIDKTSICTRSNVCWRRLDNESTPKTMNPRAWRLCWGRGDPFAWTKMLKG
jgi:hypothetical protein